MGAKTAWLCLLGLGFGKTLFCNGWAIFLLCMKAFQDGRFSQSWWAVVG